MLRDDRAALRMGLTFNAGARRVHDCAQLYTYVVLSGWASSASFLLGLAIINCMPGTRALPCTLGNTACRSGAMPLHTRNATHLY
jgi:hypothetical protein